MSHFCVFGLCCRFAACICGVC